MRYYSRWSEPLTRDELREMRSALRVLGLDLSSDDCRFVAEMRGTRIRDLAASSRLSVYEQLAEQGARASRFEEHVVPILRKFRKLRRAAQRHGMPLLTYAVKKAAESEAAALETAALEAKQNEARLRCHPADAVDRADPEGEEAHALHLQAMD